MGVLGLALTGIVVLSALFAPIIVTHEPSSLSKDRLQPPGTSHLFGTDSYGRDVFSRVILGSRESLLIALSALLIGFVLGGLSGILAGYLGGWLDFLLSRLTETMMCFPSIMLALFVLAVFGAAGKTPLIIAVGLSLVPRFARVVRGAILPIREQDYIVAARGLGAGSAGIMWRHVVPNLVGPLTVLCTIYLPVIILLEASLSFLGLGAPPDVPTWGRIIADGRPYLRTAPWISVYPGIAIMLTVIGFNLLGDGLRDILDPKTSKTP